VLSSFPGEAVALVGGTADSAPAMSRPARLENPRGSAWITASATIASAHDGSGDSATCLNTGRLFARNPTLRPVRFLCGPPTFAHPCQRTRELRLASHAKVVHRSPKGEGGRCAPGSNPWRLDLSVPFADEPRALKFERYLKSGSGCAFATRRFTLEVSRLSTVSSRVQDKFLGFPPGSGAVSIPYRERLSDPRR
jgi:hypothetical protein